MLTYHRHALPKALLALLLFAALFLSLVTPAHADDRSYSIDSVQIDATVDEDGTLHVSEKRTYDFDGQFNGVYQRLASLPKGSHLHVKGLSAECSGIHETLPEIPFNSSWRSDPASAPSGHYSFDRKKMTVYVFKKMTSEHCDITFDYAISDAVQFYDDTSDLYWQFIGDEWDEQNHDIDVRVTLPVPVGEKASAGENVLIYGHGPLDGDISLSAGVVHAHVPEAGDGDFAEMRVLYPREWGNPSKGASNVHKGKHLDEAKAEEDSYVEAPARRTRNIELWVGGASISMLAAAFIAFFRYGREYRPKFTEKYWRDVPARDVHPAVVTRIWSWQRKKKDIPVTLMHLSNIGAIKLFDLSGSQYAPYNDKDKFAIVRAKDFQGELTKIDQRAMDFLFYTVSNEMLKDKGTDTWKRRYALFTRMGGEDFKLNDVVFFSDFKKVAKKEPEKFRRAKSEVNWAVELDMGDSFEESGKWSAAIFILIGSILWMAAIPIAIKVPDASIWVIAAPVFISVVLLVMAFFMYRRAPYANEIAAKSKALKRWLEDFSRIDERPITDVKLWGEFMVYAAAFGVADKAYEQLRAVVPSVVSDSDFATTTGVWVSSGGYGDSSSTPFDALSSSVNRAASTAESAASGDSGSGGGGSFSGGGGGGFGGGGGGAF